MFSLQKILNPDDDEPLAVVRKPKHHLDVGTHRVNSIASTEKFLITGSEGEIQGWTWPSAINNSSVLPEWTIQLPANRSVCCVNIFFVSSHLLQAY